MTMNYIPLDKNKHKDLNVKLNNDFSHAKDTHLAAASLREYAQIASCMPIIFIKDPKSDTTHSVAMLGIEQGVNLFMQEGKWTGHVVPLNVQRYPFDVRPDGDKLGVFIDENSDLIDKEGEPLFVDDAPSPFLENRQKLWRFFPPGCCRWCFTFLLLSRPGLRKGLIQNLSLFKAAGSTSCDP